jgi:nucleotide sugar dehydrogenase
VGLGLLGLPTVLPFFMQDFMSGGMTYPKRTIDSIRAGKPPFIDEGVVFSIPIGDARWEVSTDFASVIPHSDIVLITVPTPVNTDKTPDLSYVRSASRSVMEEIDPERGTIVVLESTVYPGVTRKELGLICSDLGIEIGEHVQIAYSPERINPGDPLHSASSVDRIVGCDDPEIGQYLAEVYSNITSAKSSFVGPIEVAEAAKLIENVQRDIDIAFVNELATVLPLMGIDVEQVLSAAATKWNFHRHTPGKTLVDTAFPWAPTTTPLSPRI